MAMTTRERDNRWSWPTKNRADAHDQERADAITKSERETVDGHGERKREQMLMTKREQMAMTKSKRETVDGHDQEKKTLDGHDKERETVDGHHQERATVGGHDQEKDSGWP